MKKNYKIMLSAVLFAAVTVLMNACSSDESTPANVITDSDGIKVDLEWSTGGTTNDAISQADLDLYIYKDGQEVLSSTSVSSFERITFDATLYADGTYTVIVDLYETSKNVTYTATVNGITVTKPYTFNSSLASTEEGREVSILYITKAGSKFTITTVV